MEFLSSEVPEEHSSKPDPSEPWRYVCPECGGQIHALKGMSNHPHRCRGCGSYWDKDELEDKKDGA